MSVEGASTLSGTLASGAQTVTGNITASGTVQAEQLTSTDDATITDDLSVGGNAAVTGTLSAATGSSIGNLTLANGSITDSSGAISFGDENITTTGTISSGASTLSSLTVSGATALNGGLSMDTNKFTVADTSGNTAIAGTLDVTGDTSVSTFDSSGATTLASGGGVVNVASTGVMTTVKGTLNVDEAVTLDSTLDVAGNVTSSGGSISGFDASLNDQTSTSYSLQSSDNGKVVTLNNANAITLTIPSGLGDGFNCLIVQKGAGQVTLSASGTTLINRQSHSKTAGQYAVVSIVNIGDENIIVGGDTGS